MTGYKNLHRFIVFTACCTFLLIIAGGLVTSTQSGLSVPDWPTTYGHFMFAYPLDQMVGGIFYEHSHRMIASCVGFLTVIVAIWLWRREDRRWVRNLGYTALAAVIVQGILGGLTVQFLLPTPISVSHATLAQTFFSIMAALALVTSSWWRSDQKVLTGHEAHPKLFRLSVMTMVAVFIQLILGALMRHTQSGLAVPDVPLAYGQLFPSLSAEALERYNRLLIHNDIRIAADGPITSSQILIHMAHRIWAIVVAALVAWTTVKLLRTSSLPKRISRLGYVLGGAIILQITLGVLTVLSVKAVDITTAHVATGAFLLAMCVLTSLQLARIYGVRLQWSYSVSAKEIAA
ncbi:MAG TPA: COX15/CtaA family protein [Bacteroidota bacterium]|nr:COX15/CtaA family protein [Bacteroidota bacterium]